MSGNFSFYKENPFSSRRQIGRSRKTMEDMISLIGKFFFNGRITISDLNSSGFININAKYVQKINNKNTLDILLVKINNFSANELIKRIIIDNELIEIYKHLNNTTLISNNKKCIIRAVSLQSGEHTLHGRSFDFIFIDNEVYDLNVTSEGMSEELKEFIQHALYKRSIVYSLDLGGLDSLLEERFENESLVAHFGNIPVDNNITSRSGSIYYDRRLSPNQNRWISPFSF